MLLEVRAPWEAAALLAASPWLARLPAGDGHPVVVFPGLGASDITTLPSRRFLRRRGYSPYAWDHAAWRRFVVHGARRWFYKVPGPTKGPAVAAAA